MIKLIKRIFTKTNAILKDNVKIEFTSERQKLLQEQHEQWEVIESDSNIVKKSKFFTQPDFFDCL